MKYICDEQEIEELGFEYAKALKEFEAKNGDIVILWHAEKEQVVANHYVSQAEGYCLYTEICGYTFCERLEAKNIAEACAAFNTVVQTLKL